MGFTTLLNRAARANDEEGEKRKGMSRLQALKAVTLQVRREKVIGRPGFRRGDTAQDLSLYCSDESECLEGNNGKTGVVL